MNRPLIVSFGAGDNSWAMVAGLWARDIVPDAILFADPGAEHERTLAHLWEHVPWLTERGFPAPVIVRYVPVRAPYHTLEEKCLANDTLPSLAYGGHSCAWIFKIIPQQKWLATFPPALEAWARGEPVTIAIGYDAGSRDRKRSSRRYVTQQADARFTYWFPLQEWGWDRADCIEVMQHAGIRPPGKSSCFFCPAMHVGEILELRDTNPAQFARALALEANARDGRHGFDSVKGLGRRFAWSDVA